MLPHTGNPNLVLQRNQLLAERLYQSWSNEQQPGDYRNKWEIYGKNLWEIYGNLWECLAILDVFSIFSVEN